MIATTERGGFLAEVVPSGKVEFGTVDLNDGPHRLRFTAVDKNPRSPGYNMGIDVLELRPTK